MAKIQTVDRGKNGKIEPYIYKTHREDARSIKAAIACSLCCPGRSESSNSSIKKSLMELVSPM
jgi:cytochrome c-type biogenesis protein CcmH/NrfF